MTYRPVQHEVGHPICIDRVALVYGLGMVAFGIKTPPQHGPWADFLDVWRAADDIELFESAWMMDHFYPLTPPARRHTSGELDGAGRTGAGDLTTSARVHGQRHALPSPCRHGQRSGHPRPHLGRPFQSRPRCRVVRARVQRVRHSPWLPEGAVRSLRRRTRGHHFAADQRVHRLQRPVLPADPRPL